MIEILDTSDEHRNSWNADGEPGVSLFGIAIQVWAIAQDRGGVTINEAALAFNVRPDLIRQAVEDHPWMFVGRDDVIEHEGE